MAKWIAVATGFITSSALLYNFQHDIDSNTAEIRKRLCKLQLFTYKLTSSRRKTPNERPKISFPTLSQTRNHINQRFHSRSMAEMKFFNLHLELCIAEKPQATMLVLTRSLSLTSLKPIWRLRNFSRLQRKSHWKNACFIDPRNKQLSTRTSEPSRFGQSKRCLVSIKR
ncbi:hypothetical protein G9A89_007289 [Geosiphon pyriformis]|nr:hypothetical protein G9A89_007289 [Geosiphon pyriformis]